MSDDVASSAPEGSALTVVVALGANAAIAVAKTAAAIITGSASLVAESAHSWADTGNECFLLVGQRRSTRPPNSRHPDGYGREAYVWSMFAAVGLFVAGAAVSITHGVHALADPEPAGDFAVGYVVLAISALLESASFLQSLRQARREAAATERDILDHVLATSDPMLRAVFAEDASALVGIVIATAGLAAHQITGSEVPDAVGSILIGVLLGFVAIFLIDRNRQFLVGAQVDERITEAARRALLAEPEVEAVGYLRLEYVGPRQITVLAAVDLRGSPPEPVAAQQLDALRRRIEARPGVVRSWLSLSGIAPTCPDEMP